MEYEDIHMDCGCKRDVPPRYNNMFTLLAKHAIIFFLMTSSSSPHLESCGPGKAVIPVGNLWFRSFRSGPSAQSSSCSSTVPTSMSTGFVYPGVWWSVQAGLSG
eukprot:scaffold7348_cov189-Ochromonas_danica.AAC.1